MLAALSAKRVRVHRMTSILPGYDADKAPYEISPYDHHPNARTHALIADYVVRHILEPAPEPAH